LEEFIELDQSTSIDVEDRHFGAHTVGDRRGVDSSDSTTEDHDASWTDPWDTAEENSTATIALLKCCRTHLYRHTTCDFTHRSEQRKVAVDIDSLIGDRSDSALHQSISAILGGSKMEIGEEDLALTHQGVLRCDRFFDLQDHIGASPDLLCSIEDLCSCDTISII